LLLKGLGFKMNLSDDKKYLLLKVGLSYIVNIEIPKNINIYINKKMLTIESQSKINTGNFLYIVRQTKFPENYKEKGFWIKNEKRNLKEIKKT
jgi:ribosomal protein L6P/L9E